MDTDFENLVASRASHFYSPLVERIDDNCSSVVCKRGGHDEQLVMFNVVKVEDQMVLIGQCPKCMTVYWSLQTW